MEATIIAEFQPFLKRNKFAPLSPAESTMRLAVMQEDAGTGAALRFQWTAASPDPHVKAGDTHPTACPWQLTCQIVVGPSCSGTFWFVGQSYLWRPNFPIVVGPLRPGQSLCSIKHHTEAQKRRHEIEAR